MSTGHAASDAESEDPLDEFMREVEQVVQKNSKRSELAAREATTPPDEYVNDVEKEEQLVVSCEPQPSRAWQMQNEAIETETSEKQNKFENLLLPSIDHSSRAYEAFNKNLFNPPENASDFDADAFRSNARIQVWTERPLVNKPSSSSANKENRIPHPLRSFMDAGFDSTLIRAIAKHGFETPTPIQSQVIPAILTGWDVIGLAQTGSGKTLAFVWPMIVHVMDQRELVKGEGPIAVVLSPTRELAHQINVEAKRYAKIYHCKVCPIYGGLSKWEQTKLLRSLCEIVVGTPGRAIDMIKSKSLVLNRATFLVIDEADLMFSQGFEPQVRTIVDQIRPDRQTLLFSATFNRSVRRLAGDVLKNPLNVSVGVVGRANSSVTQVPVVLQDDEKKWEWLSTRIEGFAEQGKVLIFVSTKQGCHQLHDSLQKALKVPVFALHGDLSQPVRSDVVRSFRRAEESAILVGTDVASRGLDIKDVNIVVCFDAAKNFDTHVHRIGRTGRMGKEGVNEGVAYVLLTWKESKFAMDIMRSLKQSRVDIPSDLLKLANKGQASSSQRQRRGGHGSGRSDVSHAKNRFVGLGCKSQPFKQQQDTQSSSTLDPGFGQPSRDGHVARSGLGNDSNFSSSNTHPRFVEAVSIPGNAGLMSNAPATRPAKPSREELNAAKYTQEFQSKMRLAKEKAMEIANRIASELSAPILSTEAAHPPTSRILQVTSNQQIQHHPIPNQQVQHLQVPNQQAQLQVSSNQQAQHLQVPNQQAQLQVSSNQQAQHLQVSSNQQVQHHRNPNQQIPNHQTQHQQTPNHQTQHQQISHRRETYHRARSNSRNRIAKQRCRSYDRYETNRRRSRSRHRGSRYY